MLSFALTVRVFPAAAGKLTITKDWPWFEGLTDTSVRFYKGRTVALASRTRTPGSERPRDLPEPPN